MKWKKEIKKKIYIVLGVVVAIVILLCCAKSYRAQWLKEHIYEELQNVFSEEKINVDSREYVLDDNSEEYTNEADWVCGDITYNDKRYSSNMRTIDRSMVDTSVSLLEFETIYEPQNNVRVFKIINESTDYKLALEIEGIYYQYVIDNIEHKNLDEYIEIIGPKEDLTVEYIQVAFMDGQDIQKQYIYENVDVWVWNTFLGEKCTYNGYVACTCCGGNSDEENTGEWVDFNICIRDIKSNGEYFINISKHGLINVYDGKEYIKNLEYSIDVLYLFNALKALVDEYEAYYL